MSGAALLWAAIAVIVFMVGAIIAEDARYPRDDMPGQATPTPDRSGLRLVELPPIVLSHDAPQHPLTVGQAHAYTQEHRNCPAAECPRKAAAMEVLVDAGRVVPPRPRRQR